MRKSINVATCKPFLEKIEVMKNQRIHNQKIQNARILGDVKLSQTMYDPNAFVLGTKYSESFNSVY